MLKKINCKVLFVCLFNCFSAFLRALLQLHFEGLVCIIAS